MKVGAGQVQDMVVSSRGLRLLCKRSLLFYIKHVCKFMYICFSRRKHFSIRTLLCLLNIFIRSLLFCHVLPNFIVMVMSFFYCIKSECCGGYRFYIACGMYQFSSIYEHIINILSSLYLLNGCSIIFSNKNPWWLNIFS